MKIIYYYSQLNIGGAERSTIRLLNLMKKSGWDVTILLRWDNGKLEHELDDGVKRIYLKNERKRNIAGKVGETIWTLMQYLLCKIRERSLNKSDYDMAICGLFGYNPQILFKRIKAKQYYQMLRNDVEKTGKYGKTEKYMRHYGECFDSYIGVSEYTTESFKRCYPQYADRATVIYNVISEIDVNQKLELPSEYKCAQDKIKILTVGRLEDRSKGIFRMVDVAKKLVDEGIEEFVWFVVGDGPDRNELSKRISEFKLEDKMILCGGTTDPFPYYKHADLIAVLSYYEGLCGVVNEAKMMNKPVIATQFSGITEQLTNGINGYIVENTESAILNGMRNLLQDTSQIEKVAINGMPEGLRNNQFKIVQFEKLFQKVQQERERSQQ